MIKVALKSIACLIVLAAPFAAQAQAAGKVYHVGIVLPFPQEMLARRAVPVQEPFEEGLRERGWIEGKNLRILYRSPIGRKDKDPELAALAAIQELLRVPVDVLVVSPGMLEQAMHATSTVPIVTHIDANAGSERGKSIASPAGNVTGIRLDDQGGLAMKRMALLKEATGIKRVARLYLASESLRFGTDKEILPEYGIAARELGLEVFPVWASTPAELRIAFAELARRGGVGLSVVAFSRLPGLEAIWDSLLEETARYRIPAMYDTPRAVDQGGLMSYGDNIPDRWRRLSYFVDRILRGAKPADLPIEQPGRYEMVVNLKAAKSIGIQLPDAIMLQADRVIR